MGAIESGIVKVPRIPVDDDAVGDQPTFPRLWDHVGIQPGPRRAEKGRATSIGSRPRPRGQPALRVLRTGVHAGAMVEIASATAASAMRWS